MLICYVTIKLLRQTCLLIPSIVVYTELQQTFVNDFTWTHCASCLFNTTWFIYMLLLIGLTFLTHPPNKRKRISNPVAHRCTPFPGNMSFNPENNSKTLRTGLSLNVPQVSMGNLALSFRRWDYFSILRAAVSPIHKYRSEPSLYFYSLCFK